MEQIETGSFVRGNSSSISADYLHLISWNINRGLQLNSILKFLHEIKADLILLQETDVNAFRTGRRNIAREIAQGLQMNYVFGREFEELAEGRSASPALHGQATLSRLPISASRILRFRNQSGFWRPYWYIPRWHQFQRRLGGRIALVTSVKLSNTSLLLYNVHLESRGSDNLRCNQLSEIAGDLQRFRPDQPVVVAGDFNIDLTRRPAAMIVAKAGLASPFAEIGPRPTTPQGGRRRAEPIDWILTRGPLISADVRVHQSTNASDHYPLSLRIRIITC